jgi:chitobiase/beta-hexosaminidase-like protein
VTSETVWNNFGGASGGGISTFFARPFWQTGIGVPSGSTRLVPDVSSAADPSTGALVILNGQQTQFGGTSWSAPVWAGFCALINQARADASLPPTALLGPKLYPLLRTTAYRDILVGSNGAYRAGVGYDLCTGVGVPDISVLLSPLTGGPTPPPAPAPPPFGEIFDPPPDSMLTSSTVTFGWTPGTATAYWLLVGTSRGNQDIFSSGQVATQSITVRNIPTDGRPIFVILLSLAQGRWFTQEYQYTAAVENLATPIINPNGGTFRRRVKIKLTEITPGAAIFYTTDGSTPTVDSTLYQSPFILKSSRTVKAIAITPGVLSDSDVAAASFIIRRRAGH